MKKLTWLQSWVCGSMKQYRILSFNHTNPEERFNLLPHFTNNLRQISEVKRGRSPRVQLLAPFPFQTTHTHLSWNDTWVLQEFSCSRYNTTSLYSSNCVANDRVLICLFTYLLFLRSSCMSANLHECTRKVRGQDVQVRSLLPPCGSWRQNSGCQPQWQAPLPTEPSCWLHYEILKGPLIYDQYR